MDILSNLPKTRIEEVQLDYATLGSFQKERVTLQTNANASLKKCQNMQTSIGTVLKKCFMPLPRIFGEPIPREQQLTKLRTIRDEGIEVLKGVT